MKLLKCEWLEALSATFQREIKQLPENRQLVFFCFILPVIWILIVWGLLGDGVMQSLPVGLVDQDKSSQSREVIRAISACRAVEFVPYIEPDVALNDLKCGKIYGVMVFPAGYGRNQLKGQGGTISLYLDENRYAVAGVLSSEIESALQAEKEKSATMQIMSIGASPGQALRFINVIHGEFEVLGNIQTSFLSFLGSTLIPSLIMIGAMFTFVTAFLRELWDHTFREWIRISSGLIGAAIIGKLLPYYIAYCFIFLFYLVLFTGSGGNLATGSIFVWIALGLACLAAFAGAAIIVAAISPTWRMALVISAGYAAPALPFTGFSMPIESMSSGVAAFGRCLPLTWYIQGQTEVWTLGANISKMSMTFGGQFCIIIICWIVGVVVMRWRANRYAEKEVQA